jgi:hypothetical protein
MLETVVSTIEPPKAQTSTTASRTGSFDLEAFIAKHLKAGEPVAYKDGRKWTLEACPFNPEHKDAAIFESSGGKFGFHCFHESCSTKSWHHVRELYEGPRQTFASATTHTPAHSPEPAPGMAEPSTSETPTGPQLVEEVEQFIRKYVVLPGAAYLPATIWIIATHAARQFDCFPYLAVLSPAKRCGKTRLFEVMEPLAYNSWFGTAPSPAALYRMMAEAPTLLLDEVEIFNVKNKSESAQALLAILNAGHRKGATVPRCDGPKHELRLFPVYGPKAFAAIGRLPDTLADRSLIIGMQRKTKKQKTAPFRMRRAKAEAKPIQDAAAEFARAHQDSIGQTYHHLADADLGFLGDRDADLWSPLFAICAVGAPDRVEELKKCALALSGTKASTDVDDSLPIKLLDDIRRVWPKQKDEPPAPLCFTATLIEKLKVLEDAPWAEFAPPLTGHKLSRMLKPFGAESKTIRMGEGEGAKVARGYEFASLEVAFYRYLEDQSVTSATSQ